MDTLFSGHDFNSTDIQKAIRKFNSIKPHIKNEFFECDVFFSCIFTPSFTGISNSMHQHSFYELHIPISGKAIYSINDKKITCTTNKIFLFSPNNTHRRISSEGYVSVTFGFSFIKPATLVTKPLLNNAYTELECNPYISNSIFYILHSLLDETTTDHYIFNSIFSVIIYDILLHIPAFKNEFISNNEADLGYFSDDARIRMAIQYISDNIAFPISVTDVANHLFLSSRQLNRILKNALNISTNELINDIRIKAAKQYMTNTDYPLSKIAPMCGFNSATHFNLTFKKATGLTPKLYRELNDIENRK